MMRRGVSTIRAQKSINTESTDITTIRMTLRMMNLKTSFRFPILYFGKEKLRRYYKQKWTIYNINLGKSQVVNVQNIHVNGILQGPY